MVQVPREPTTRGVFAWSQLNAFASPGKSRIWTKLKVLLIGNLAH